MSLSFIYSTMDGGKSTRLLQTAHSIRSRGFETVVIGYAKNTREPNVKSRIGIETNLDCSFQPFMKMSKLIKGEIEKKDAKVLAVLIDEAQFLTPMQVEDLLLFTLTTDVLVTCFGLKVNFASKLFPGSKRLLELADSIEELSIVRCRCGKKASFNGRFNGGGGLLLNGPEEIIDDDDAISYDPLCSRCFFTEAGILADDHMIILRDGV